MLKSLVRLLGSSAEKLAEDYFRERDYEVLARNFTTSLGEIDLILCKGDLLVFVEVKSASQTGQYFPEEKVNRKKQEKILKVAEIFLLKNSQKLSKIKRIRFDVVAIDLEKGDLKHYEAAFFAEP